MTKDKLNAAMRVQALAHARNCVVAQNHATPNALDMPALHELDALIDQGASVPVSVAFGIAMAVVGAWALYRAICESYGGWPPRRRR